MDMTPYQPKWRTARILVSVERYARGAALALIMGMTLLGFLEVVLRYFFNSPILGVNEIQSYLVPVVVSLALAATQYDKKHIRMEILYDRLPVKARRAADYLALIVSLAVWVLIAWQTIVTGNHYMASGRTINMIHVNMGYVQYIAAFGSALLCLEMARQLFRLASSAERPASGATVEEGLGREEQGGAT